MRSGERAQPPMTKARSAALSARSDGLDDVNGGPECGVYTQMRGIEQVSVGGRREWGGAAPRIALVAPQQLGQDLALFGVLAAPTQLENAALGADLWRRHDEEFHVGAGGDHGADVAAVEHGAGTAHG